VIDGDASTHVPVYPSRLSKRFSRLMRRKGLTSIGSKDAQTDTTAPLIDALDGDRLPEVSAALKAEASREVDARTVGRPSPYGICLSAGGIRSAAFSLGVLQEMNKHGMLHGPKRADYLSSVSGGSYMAGAVAIVQRGRFPKTRAPTPKESKPPPDPIVPSTSMPAFAPGSPEETYLRDNTRYLTHGWADQSLRYGACSWGSCGIFDSGAHGGPHLRGTWLGLRIAAAVAPGPLRFDGTRLCAASPLLISGVGLRRRHRHGGSRSVDGDAARVSPVDTRRHQARASRGLTRTRRWGRALASRGRGRSDSLGMDPLRFQYPANSGAAPSRAQGPGTWLPRVGSVWRRRADSLVRHQSLADGPGRMGRGSGWRQGGSRDPSKELAAASTCSLVNLLAALIGPLTVVLTAVFALDLGSLYPLTTGGRAVFLAVALWAIALVVGVVIWSFGDVTAWSMHPFYGRV